MSDKQEVTPKESEAKESPASPELDEQQIEEVAGGLALRRADRSGHRVENAPRITIRVEPI